MAQRAQQLLEHSLLGELRSVVARALSGLDMFEPQLKEFFSSAGAPGQLDSSPSKVGGREGGREGGKAGASGGCGVRCAGFCPALILESTLMVQ